MQPAAPAAGRRPVASLQHASTLPPVLHKTTHPRRRQRRRLPSAPPEVPRPKHTSTAGPWEDLRQSEAAGAPAEGLQRRAVNWPEDLRQGCELRSGGSRPVGGPTIGLSPAASCTAAERSVATCDSVLFSRNRNRTEKTETDLVGLTF